MSTEDGYEPLSERALRRLVEDTEDELLAAKDSDEEVTRELRERLRQLRHRYRTVRGSSGQPPAPDPGPDAWRTAARDERKAATAEAQAVVAALLEPSDDDHPDVAALKDALRGVAIVVAPNPSATVGVPTASVHVGGDAE